MVTTSALTSSEAPEKFPLPRTPYSSGIPGAWLLASKCPSLQPAGICLPPQERGQWARSCCQLLCRNCARHTQPSAKLILVRVTDDGWMSAHPLALSPACVLWRPWGTQGDTWGCYWVTVKATALERKPVYMVCYMVC